jgi:hypothetical protein
MWRAALVWSTVLVLGSKLLGCADNPHWIGRYPVGDAAPRSECEITHDGALVCADFEGDALDGGAFQTVLESTGELELSSERAHDGARALRATTTGVMSFAALAQNFDPVRGGELHLRAYLYVAGEQPTEIMNILFIGASGAVAEFDGIDINLQGGALQVFAPQAGVRETSEQVIPRDRWFCLRLRLEVHDASGTLELFTDDELALRVAAFDTLPASGISELRAGIDWSSEQSEPFEIFIDDLVLDTSEVACAAP